MRRVMAMLGVTAVTVLGLAGCGGGGSTEDFCALETKLNLADSGGDFDDLDSALDDAVAAAPDEIKGDVEIVRDTFDKIFGQLRDQDVSNLADVTPEQTQALQELNTEEFKQASTNIDQFITENCDTGS
ncbi:MAG: hypothetical protein M3Q17_02170 [Actinomycetota bacterium]|nr:hypothetical protein [Actinomycetota bacterium]